MDYIPIKDVNNNLKLKYHNNLYITSLNNKILIYFIRVKEICNFFAKKLSVLKIFLVIITNKNTFSSCFSHILQIKIVQIEFCWLIWVNNNKNILKTNIF